MSYLFPFPSSLRRRESICGVRRSVCFALTQLERECVARPVDRLGDLAQALQVTHLFSPINRPMAAGY
jgi:hypothetical protein